MHSTYPSRYCFNTIQAAKIGNMYCMAFDKQGVPKIAIGPNCNF
jgi:hypothetical protein